jgi:hypothetical protein
MKQERLSNMNHIKNQYNINSTHSSWSLVKRRNEGLKQGKDNYQKKKNIFPENYNCFMLTIFFALSFTAFSRCALLEKHTPIMQQQTSVNGPNYTIQVMNPIYGFHKITPQGNPSLHPMPPASEKDREFVLSNYCGAIEITKSPFTPHQEKLCAQQTINGYYQDHPWLQAVNFPVVQKQINKTSGHSSYQERFSVIQLRPQPLPISTVISPYLESWDLIIILRNASSSILYHLQYPSKEKERLDLDKKNHKKVNANLNSTNLSPFV